MRWRNRDGKQYDLIQQNKDAAPKWEKQFALLPVQIAGDTIWLEHFLVLKVFDSLHASWRYLEKRIID